MGYKKLSNFRGIQFTPFCLNANTYDGFGFYLCSIDWKFRNPNVAIMGFGWSLFAINYRKNPLGKGGWEKRLWINLFGIFKKAFILNRLIVIDTSEFEEDEL